jgi:hypothetical protein
MPSGILLTGRRFGLLLVVRESRSDVYLCSCRCGKNLTVFRSQLTNGAIRCCVDCGSKSKKRSLYYGHIRYYIGRDGRRHQKSSSEFLSWCAMRERCFTKTNINFPEYGGRGITVCPNWRIRGGQGFRNFLLSMGPRPVGNTLDRRDVQGHYTPENCEWSDLSTQAMNQRRWLFPDGNEPPLADVPFDLDPEFACG